jgi:hypothetical protein
LTTAASAALVADESADLVEELLAYLGLGKAGLLCGRESLASKLDLADAGEVGGDRPAQTELL